MLPNSRSTNAQHNAQRIQFPSIIRTRSQRQQPLTPLDLYASPLKEAIRNYNHNQPHTAHHTQHDHNLGTGLSDDEADEILLSPSHKKRPSSPSFGASDHAEKRIRVLGQSSKVNSLSRRHSEESLGTPSKSSILSGAKEPSTPKRAVHSGSRGKEIAHLDLNKVSGSPAKTPGSPTKTFKITTLDGGTTMRVPITPRRAVSGGSGLCTPGAKHYTPPSPSKNENTPRAVRFSSPAAHGKQPLSTLPHYNKPSISIADGIRPTHDTDINHEFSTAHFYFKSTPVRSRLLGGDLLFGGSPLTPLPPTPHPLGSTAPHRPTLPHNNSNEGPSDVGSKLGVGCSSLAGQPSPSKSRIPVLMPSAPSSSRLPRPSSSLSISNLPAAGPPSPTKATQPHGPMKPKTRSKGKPKSGVRSKAPFTRLAAKRGIRRTSSLGVGLRPGTSSSAMNNVPSSSLDSAGPSNLNPSVGAPSTERKKSLVTSSQLSTENAALLRPPSILNLSSASPTKPTPLSALSTALQKLLVNPPTAPLPRSRPNTSLGFSYSPAQAQDPRSTYGNDADPKTPGSSQQSSTGLVRSRTSLGHSRPLGPTKRLGRMGLPLRQTAVNARPAPGTSAPFASKQTTLSTVPASPSRSVVPPSMSAAPPSDAPPSSLDMRVGVVDVDAWVAPDLQDVDKGKAKEEANRTEYVVPLADEPQTKPQLPLGLVSPSRRASQAGISLTQSLSLPRVPSQVKPPIPRAASTSNVIPRTPVKTRGRTKPPVPAAEPAKDENANAKQNDPMGGKRSNARMPGSLDVLRDCVIFVDVRTEEGEDAAGLFIDMLRGLGARILAKPGKSCTHLVYKSGLPSTITKYKLLPEPRPLPVSIGWVVECVEKREHVDETRFLVNMNEIGVAGGAQRRRSMQPKQMRIMSLGQLDNGEAADISVRADSSFTSEEPSTTGLILTGLSPPTRSPDNNLPPLERARQRSFRLSRE